MHEKQRSEHQGWQEKQEARTLKAEAEYMRKLNEYKKERGISDMYKALRKFNEEFPEYRTERDAIMAWRRKH